MTMTMTRAVAGLAPRRDAALPPSSARRRAAAGVVRATVRAKKRTTSKSRRVVSTTTRARMGGGGIAEVAGNAAIAVVEVSKAVRMRGVDAPTVEKSYVSKGRGAGAGDDASADGPAAVDAEGLPLVYDAAAIQAFWAKQGGALQRRWGEFLSLSVPFLTRVATLSITGGAAELSKNEASLARDARVIIEKLGPTYIKAGQMMSVRPDVLPQAALDELAILQDAVKPFATTTAIETIEAELGGALGEFFDEISEAPVAAASLAQVYRAKLAGTDTYVAVKVQRPEILSTVSKDLYVLRRAAEVYQGLIERFAPQQRTDYVALLNEWAVGFYTELDFLNEADNQQRLRDLIAAEKVQGVYVPEVYHEMCTRRVLVSEWIDGTKLSDCPKDEIRELIGVGQECFLVQLLQVGFFHSDPHPGNLMKMVSREDPSKNTLVILDFGLMASIEQSDMDTMVSSIIHLANKDYPALVDDFIDLKILPDDCDRAKVIPLMDKALSPYVKGGGAKKYEAELKKMYDMDGSLQSTAGGFQAMTQDLLTVLNDIPFSIPPYFALLGRAVVTLEGIALIGNPDYRLVMEAYPFVARKLLREDRPAAQRALQEVLYASTVGGGNILQGQRLAVMLNSAMGVVARDQSEGAFVDLDTIPEDSISLETGVRYLLSERAESLRKVLEREAIGAADVLLRQGARKSGGRIIAALPQPPSLPFDLPFVGKLPKPEDLPGPILVPRSAASGLPPTPALASPNEVLDAIAPRLTREEELFAISLTDLARGSLGDDAAVVLSGDALLEPEAVASLLLGVLATGRTPVGDSPQLAALAKSVRERLLPAANAADADADVANAASGANDGFEELSAAVRDLTPEESAVLSATAQSVADALWAKLVARMEEGLLSPEQRGAGASGRSTTVEGGGGGVAANAANGSTIGGGVEVAGEAVKTPLELVVAMAR